LIFVLLVSVGMSWLAVKLEKARRQKEAVEAIEKAGGVVLYDYHFDADDGLSGAYRVRLVKLTAPAWLRRWLGDDFVANVVAVDLPQIDQSKAGRRDGPLWMITGPVPHDAWINDSDLLHFNLKCLTGLQDLRLDGAQVSDVGLLNLQDLTSLRFLNLQGTQVTPEGVKKLQEALPDCEIVY
jgi:hypothetical protein